MPPPLKEFPEDPSTLSDYEKILNDSHWGPLLVKFCKKEHNEENIMFLARMIKGDKTEVVYRKYVAQRAPQQVNLAGPVVAKFEAAIEAAEAKGRKVAWGRLPWGDAEKEILKVMKDPWKRFAAAMKTA